MNTNNDLYDVAIIGGGPSGLTAGIYTSRAFLSTVIFAGSPPGGQLTTTTDVENFPGFPNGIMGPDLINLMSTQSKKFGANVYNENIARVEGDFAQGFTLTTESGARFKAKTIIVATGASANWLGLQSEQRLRGKGVSACATCDGFFFKGKTVAVVGGGDASMEESTYLTKYANKVYVLVRSTKEAMKASKVMQQRAFANPKIEFLFNTELIEVLGDHTVSGLKVRNNITNAESVLTDVSGLFIAIGHTPNTDFLKGIVELDARGYIKLSNGTSTSVEGIFVSGDVADSKYRQAVTAAGFGCMAALDVEKFLSHN